MRLASLIAALQYHRSTSYDVLNATSVTNFARVSRLEELTELVVDSAQDLLVLMHRLLCACTQVDSEFPKKHHAPLVVTLLLEGGGDVTATLLPILPPSTSEARGGGLRAELLQAYHPAVLDHMLRLSAANFVSLVLCLENARGSEVDIESTLELGVRLSPKARLVPDAIATKKEVLEQRLKAIKNELGREESEYTRSIRKGEAREIIEQLREMI